MSTNYYLVLLKDSDPKSLDRTEIYNHWQQVTQEAIENIGLLLEREGLLSEVGQIGEPMGLPVFFISCTERVVERLKQLPDVQAVILDESQSESDLSSPLEE